MPRNQKLREENDNVRKRDQGEEGSATKRRGKPRPPSSEWLRQRQAAGRKTSDEAESGKGKHTVEGTTVGGVRPSGRKQDQPKSILHTFSRPKYRDKDEDGLRRSSN